MLYLRPNILAWLVALGGTVTAGSPSNDSFCVSHAVSPGQQQALWDTFVQQWYFEKAPGYISTLMHKYMVSDYIQHNTYLPPIGAQQNIDALEKILGLYNTTTYHIADIQENIGWIHWRVQGGPNSNYPNETAVIDLYRFNGSCIVEHWDIIQSATNTTTNPIAFF